jgi:stage V sporulation protein SpoVS
MTDGSPNAPDGIRISTKTDPTRAGVHLFELMRDGGKDDVTVVCIGGLALQQAFHTVVALNQKLSTRGEQVTVYPTYEVVRGPGGDERTSNRLRLIRKPVSFSNES